MTSPKAIPLSTTSVRKPPRQPLLWAVLAYGAGITVGSYAWRPPLWWVVAALVFLGAGAYYVRRRVWAAFGLALGACFFTAALAMQASMSCSPIDDGALVLADGEEVIVTGHLTHEGEIREAGFGGWRQSGDVETEQASSGEKTIPVRAGVRVGIYEKESAQESDESGARMPMRIFRYGERLRFATKLRAPRNFRNPGAAAREIAGSDRRGIAARHYWHGARLGGLRTADYRVAMPETSMIVIGACAVATAMVGGQQSEFDFGENVVSPYLWEGGFRGWMWWRSRMGTPITSAEVAQC